MADIWIDQHSRLKSYSAAVKGAKSVVRIEIECDEPGSLGYLLKGLGDIQREQELKTQQEKAAKKAAANAKPLALAAPLLRIADMRGDSE